MENRKLLFLWSGPCFVNDIKYSEDQISCFSRNFPGTIIAFTFPKFMNTRNIGNFDFIPIQISKTSRLQNAKLPILMFLKGLQQVYANKNATSIIISPNPLTTGLIAIIIKKLTSAKVIIEINGNFKSAFSYGAAGAIEPTWSDRVKGVFAKAIGSFVLPRADAVRVLYKDQLDYIDKKHVARIRNLFCVPEYCDVKSFLNFPSGDRKYILFLGFPWYLKGVDVLIKAFVRISTDFPVYKLKVVGYCPDGRDYFEGLAKGNNNIELMNPVFHGQVPELMANCSLFVLPSRTEAMGRVLVEAMACRKPVIGSDVDGIPTVIKDGINGFLFESENVSDLAEKMRKILSNKELAIEFGKNGFDTVMKYFSEDCYISNYKQMIDAVSK
jgi:glycosyltransferase involved in cell wall biosynthesis